MNAGRSVSMAKKDLFFSIVIANYNYGHFLRQAIESALAQKWGQQRSSLWMTARQATLRMSSIRLAEKSRGSLTRTGASGKRTTWASREVLPGSISEGVASLGRRD